MIEVKNVEWVTLVWHCTCLLKWSAVGVASGIQAGIFVSIVNLFYQLRKYFSGAKASVHGASNKLGEWLSMQEAAKEIKFGTKVA